MRQKKQIQVKNKDKLDFRESGVEAAKITIYYLYHKLLSIAFLDSRKRKVVQKLSKRYEISYYQAKENHLKNKTSMETIV